MKNIVWAIVILIIGIGIVTESRYELVVHSPVVAKLDRVTGDVWIVNAGIWRKVEHPSQEKIEAGRLRPGQAR